VCFYLLFLYSALVANKGLIIIKLCLFVFVTEIALTERSMCKYKSTTFGYFLIFQWQFGLVVTLVGASTKLPYVEPG